MKALLTNLKLWFASFAAVHFPKHTSDTVLALFAISGIALLTAGLAVYDQVFGQGWDMGEGIAVAFFACIVIGVYHFGTIERTKNR